ncbi:hypothetical protein ANCCAN_28787 [Ancylostoma caninum]|uniref:Uncharacterized protein n=1 Tax=Ancylostoma caninum TaxID=29170 RepID=A0A368F3B5_ANCCA|nr:hypothetical protein ANCCAN_28787 [Ancylostoma caninum]
MIRRRLVSRKTASFSLQHKFQDKENGRTGPVYTSISVNELLSSIVTSVIYGCIGAARKGNDIPRVTTLSNTLDLIDSYRYLFINLVILVNSFLWIRSQKRVFINRANGDEYFQQLETAWT